MARLASIGGWLYENKILTNLAIYETSSIAGVQFGSRLFFMIGRVT